jgi:hypothetical protein
MEKFGVNLWWLSKRFSAITLFGVVYYRSKAPSEKLRKHELVHVRQQTDYGMMLFTLIYCVNYIVNLLIYCNFYRAYYELKFEKEARK